jgi:hypothetical protein
VNWLVIPSIRNKSHIIYGFARGRQKLACGLLMTILSSLPCDGKPREAFSPAGHAAILPVEAARSAYDFVNSIGVNTHLNYFDRVYGNFQLVERELQSIGIHHLRDGVHLQNSDYNLAVYGRWAELGKLGIRFDAVLDPRSNLGPLNADKLTAVNDLAGGSIESFEGPNELDISRMPDWESVDRRYQAEIYGAAKSMPNAKSIQVIGPSMASASNGSAVGNTSGYMDYGNLHPYPAAKMPSIVFPSQVALAHTISGDKQIVITESGYHNALNDHHDQPAVSEEAAAKYIPRLFLEDFAHGIVRTYLYEFLDELPNPRLTDLQLHWGLIRSDGSEKPAFTAMKNLIAELSDSTAMNNPQSLRYSLSGGSSQLHHLLLEKSTGQFLLVLWQEVPSYDYDRQRAISNPLQPVTLTLDQAAKNISIYEPVVQAQPLHAYANAKNVYLEVPDHPLVVEITLR